MAIPRRDFLLMSAAVVPLTWSGAAASPEGASEPWYRSMRRCAQHNINEYDPEVLDIESWLNYWESLKVNALVLTAGGFMAFYPTKLPNHHRSQFLGERDFFGDYSKAAKKRGIRVVARIETNWLHEDVLKARPEWFERAEDGTPSANEESRYAYQTCMFSTYHEEQVPAIIREVGARYDVDGFFTNSWPSTSAPRPCYCVNCRKFGVRSKSQLLEQSQQRILYLCEMLAAVCKEQRADRVYNVNIAGGIHSVQSIKKLAAVGEWLNADHQGRAGGDVPIWDCSQQGRIGYSAMRGKPVTNAVTANAHNWRHTSKSEAELEMWLAQTTASGMIPWLIWLGSGSEDPRWRDTGKNFYQWLAKHERHFVNRRPISRLGVVYSQRINYLYDSPGSVPGGYGARVSKRPPALGDPTDYLQGLYYALLEGRFVFDFVHEENLNATTLDEYSVLLLPNIALLSDEQCRELRAFVDKGGSLLATFETSLFDETGKARTQLGLSDVFGAEAAGGRKGAFFYASKHGSHDVLRGFEQTEWLPAGEWRVPLKTRGKSILSVVPPYPRGIPELVYPHARAEMDYPGVASHEPAIVLQEKGKSRIAYLPFDIDRCAWKYGNTDLSALLQNAIRWVTRDQAAVRVEGHGIAEAVAWETEPGYAVHILNYNNPNMTRPWFRKDYPIGPQRVTVQLPLNVKISRVELLRAGTKPQFRQKNGAIEFTIHRVVDYEVAALSKA